jgi:tRNA (guanine-N7-)-methyltransferase
MTAPKPTAPREKFYGRRKGKKLRSTRERGLEEILPSITCPVGLPPDAAKYKAIWLEVGFGSGEHLADQAVANPDVLIIGCEPFINGVAKLCQYVDERNLKNVRIYADDARLLMDALPDGSLQRVFVLFADPWPKNRHAERRFIGGPNLDRLARLMPLGAELRLASDHPVLKRWTLAQMRRRSDFKWRLDKCHQWLQRPADWPATRYEQKALHGVPHFYTFVRC